MENNTSTRLPGGTYFFTTRLADPASTLLVDEIDILRNATRLTMRRYPFSIDAVVILPATMHTIWHLPYGDSNFSIRWSMLKSLFSRDVPTPAIRSAAQIKRGDKGIWQRRFWDHLIRDGDDYDAHLNMIHTSPVQAGLCALPQDWAHSSVHRLLADKKSMVKDSVSSGMPAIPTRAATYHEEGFAHSA